MPRHDLVSRLLRAGAVLGVGTVLVATSVAHDPCEEDPATELVECPPCQPQPDAVTFAISSTCGPSGTLEASFTGTCSDDLMDVAGGPAVGLPDGGLLDYPAGGWEPSTETHVIQEGRFVLLGPVPLPGPVNVHRTCRLTASAEPGTFDFSCAGPQPEAGCAGTFTRVDPAP